MTENIRYIRLVTGDELVGDVISNGDGYYQITDPMVLDDMQDSSTGKIGIVLNKYCPFSEDDYVSIRESDVVCSTSVHPIVKEYYYQSVRYSDKFMSNILNQLEAVVQIMNNSSVSDPERYIHKGSSTTN